MSSISVIPTAYSAPAPSNATNVVNKSSSSQNASDSSSTSPNAADLFPSSSAVTLSDAGKQLAGLNAKDIGFDQVSFADMSSGGQPTTTDQVAQFLKDVNGRSVSAPLGSDGKYDGATSKDDFTSAIEQLEGGGTQTSAEQLFSELDTNGDGSISTDELFKGLGQITTTPDSDSSQALLHLMDSNGDGSVSFDEYATVQTALIASEKPTEAS